MRVIKRDVRDQGIFQTFRRPIVLICSDLDSDRGRDAGCREQVENRSELRPANRCGDIIATLFLGFNWGGWMLGSTAETNATNRVNTALVQVYTPVCVKRFQQQANIDAKWAELTKVSSWQRDNYIEKTGFATPPGADIPNSQVADSCATALSKIIAMQTPAAK